MITNISHQLLVSPVVGKLLRTCTTQELLNEQANCDILSLNSLKQPIRKSELTMSVP